MLVLLLPIIFMIHDFEEIIFFKKWVQKYEVELTQRFPKIGKIIINHLKSIST
ncbi:HXXEE domain-containing protein, partial [Riemerella anatipestifer]